MASIIYFAGEFLNLDAFPVIRKASKPYNGKQEDGFGLCMAGEKETDHYRFIPKSSPEYAMISSYLKHKLIEKSTAKEETPSWKR